MSSLLRPARFALIVVVAATLAGAGPVTEAGALSQEQKTLVQLTNDARDDAGLKELKVNRRLSKYAKRHSKKMAARDELFHTKNLARVLSRRVTWRVGAENVGVGSDLVSLQDTFMDSSGHRKNILGKKFDRVATGVVQENGRYWVTVIFYGK